MKSAIGIVNVEFVMIGRDCSHWTSIDDLLKMTRMTVDFDTMVE